MTLHEFLHGLTVGDVLILVALGVAVGLVISR